MLVPLQNQRDIRFDVGEKERAEEFQKIKTYGQKVDGLRNEYLRKIGELEKTLLQFQKEFKILKQALDLPEVGSKYVNHDAIPDAYVLLKKSVKLVQEYWHDVHHEIVDP